MHNPQSVELDGCVTSGRDEVPIFRVSQRIKIHLSRNIRILGHVAKKSPIILSLCIKDRRPRSNSVLLQRGLSRFSPCRIADISLQI